MGQARFYQCARSYNGKKRRACHVVWTCRRVAEIQASEAIPAGQPRVLAEVVLYRAEPDCGESAALRTLLAERQREPAWARDVAVVVWDNSPRSRELPVEFDGVSRADTANPGLRAAYEFTLGEAVWRDVPWVLLLDQDTEVTAEYLAEVLRETSAAGPGVGALLPRLVHRGAVVSPVHPQRLGPPREFDGTEAMVQGFNSGAVLRVAAMQAVGGFDRRFPLDYLDHATFAALQRGGWRVRVLGSRLQHGLSSDTGRAATVGERRRQASTLQAERRFYWAYGDGTDRVLHPLRLLRRAVSVVIRKGDWRSGVQFAGAAMGTLGQLLLGTGGK